MKEERKIPDSFGTAMEYYRKKKGITFRELEEQTGISSAYLCRIEKGVRKSPSLIFAGKIVKSLGMPKQYLLEILDLEDDLERKDIDLCELLLLGDYTIEGTAVGTDVKEMIADLWQFIFLCHLDKSSLIEEVLLLYQKIETLKEYIILEQNVIDH